MEFPSSIDRCTHEHQELRRRMFSDGAQHYVMQCMECGTQIRAVGKSDPKIRALYALPPEFDDSITPSYWERRVNRIREASAARLADRRATYHAYLESQAWRNKRGQRLRVDDWLCQAKLDGCTRAATDVHHLTYTHVGNEPLFDLVSVCRACHEQITAMDHPVEEVAHERAS